MKKMGRALRLGELVQTRLEKEVMGMPSQESAPWPAEPWMWATVPSPGPTHTSNDEILLGAHLIGDKWRLLEFLTFVINMLLLIMQTESSPSSPTPRSIETNTSIWLPFFRTTDGMV